MLQGIKGGFENGAGISELSWIDVLAGKENCRISLPYPTLSPGEGPLVLIS